jgi:sigma-B regulation protein RsbU (phosphoserine phosphatase)
MDTQGGRILIVDDNELNRDMLARRLTKRGYDTTMAESGEEALSRVAAEEFDLVLLDIEMPGMDGFQVLDKLRETRSASDLPVIMATARSDSKDIVEALNREASDYVTKPLDFPVVLARVHAQLAVKRSRDALAQAHNRMKKDLDAAARFQQSLLPEPAMDSGKVLFAWRYRPCTELGGDALNVFTIDEHHVGFYLLDVSGHGVPASLLAVSVAHSLTPGTDPAALVAVSDPKTGQCKIATPAEVASRLNDLFPMGPNDGHYFTLAYGVLNHAECTLRLITAGQPAPFQLHADGKGQAINTRNMPIGLFPGTAYEDKVVEIRTGDRVYLYSDGLVEASRGNGTEFGQERLAEAARSAAHLPLDQSLDIIVKAAEEWQDGVEFEDDLSIIAVETTGT